MTAEIISVGTELLLGNIINTNAAFLSQALAGIGVSVYRQTTVGDNHKRFFCALSSALQASDVVIITGGLGPTQDDITKAVVADFFNHKLVMHEESLLRIRERFLSRGRNLPPNTERNALVLQNAQVLPNDNGCAPGIIVEENNKMVILLPGPPHEMKPMFTNHALPILQNKSGNAFVSITFKIIGIGESQVEDALLDLISAQTNPTIAPYANISDVHVRVTAAAETETAASKLIAPIAEEIYNRLGNYIYTTGEETLAEVVVTLLRTHGYTIAVAESCTGGLVMAELVGVAGCSDVVLEGVCTYSNQSKIQRLGICPQLLAQHGAVSAQVAAAMAQNVAKTSNATVGVSTTGIAGPGGGTADKPVGLVYIGVYVNGNVETQKLNLTGSRNEVRTRAAWLVLDMLRRMEE